MSLVASTESAKLKHEQLLALYATGWNVRDLSERFGYSTEYIKQLVREPEYAETIRGLQQLHIKKNLSHAAEQLQTYASEAVLTLAHLMRTSASDTVRAACANSILDRMGLSKRTVLELEEKQTITPEVAKYIVDVLKEGRQELDELEMVEDSAGVFVVKSDLESLLEESADEAAKQGEEDPAVTYGGYGGPPE